jgi:hypothetical protein
MQTARLSKTKLQIRVLVVGTALAAAGALAAVPAAPAAAAFVLGR